MEEHQALKARDSFDPERAAPRNRFSRGIEAIKSPSFVVLLRAFSASGVK
jgi:hypothetical protein